MGVVIIFITGGFAMVGYILDDYYPVYLIHFEGWNPDTETMYRIPTTFMFLFAFVGVFFGVFLGYRMAWYYSIKSQIEKDTERR